MNMNQYDVYIIYIYIFFYNPTYQLLTFYHFHHQPAESCLINKKHPFSNLPTVFCLSAGQQNCTAIVPWVTTMENITSSSQGMFYGGESLRSPTRKIRTYCWWLKSCTTWDVWNPINNGINYLSTGAGFQPSTVGMVVEPTHLNKTNSQIGSSPIWIGVKINIKTMCFFLTFDKTRKCSIFFVAGICTESAWNCQVFYNPLQSIFPLIWDA